MKTTMRIILSALICTTAALATPTPGLAKICYPPFLPIAGHPPTDADGDGYAHSGAVGVEIEVAGVTCPGSYVNMADDCNDNDARIHPRRSEIGLDQIDNNCNGRIDEATFLYRADGHENTQTGFTMTTLLNHNDLLRYADNLYGEVEVARLVDSANSTRLEKFRIEGVQLFNREIEIPVTGLQAGVVYRARVRFYKKEVNGTYTRISGTSEWYYTATDGTTEKSRTRTAMVLKAFKEVDESNRGRVGYLGTVDPNGTRYGADADEQWCSEFYAWVTKTWLEDMASNATVTDLVKYFQDYGAYYDDETEILAVAARGDYIPLDTDEDGKKNHSAMFLAYDTSQDPPKMWIVEGGGRVRIRQLVLDNSVKGLGHIVSAQFK